METWRQRCQVPNLKGRRQGFAQNVNDYEKVGFKRQNKESQENEESEIVECLQNDDGQKGIEGEVC